MKAPFGLWNGDVCRKYCLSFTFWSWFRGDCHALECCPGASGSKEHFWDANYKKIYRFWLPAAIGALKAILGQLPREMGKETVGVFFPVEIGQCFPGNVFRGAVRRCCSRNQLVLLLRDTAFVMLCERPKNHSFIITFVLEIELFVPRILSMKYRGK